MALLSSFNDSFLPGDSFINSSGPISSLPSKYTTNCVKLHAYPEINISKEIFNSHISQQDHLILPVQETLIKKFTQTLIDEGLKCSLEILETSESVVLSGISKGLLKIMNYGNRLKIFLNPYKKEIPVDQYDNYSEVRNWKTSAIRFIAFHPQCFKIAVASVDDSIRIYNDKNSVVTVLKNAQQKSIFALAFRPYNFSTLVVGCSSGMLIWTIDPNSNMTRPLSQAVLCRHENHFPVTSLEFNHNGNLLATASINDTSILIWDIDKNTCVPLRRFSVPFLKLQWSLNGSYLFTSTVGNIFRVWDCEKFKSDRWTISGGHIQSFQWSPCAKFLLFVTSKDPVLYCLGFADEPLFNKSNEDIHRALPIADLSKVTIEHNESGGISQQLAWNGKYLAVSFKESNQIAVFQTTIRQHQLHVLPMFFICGLGASEYPSFISFQPFYKANSSNGLIEHVLTIGWSSGRVQFYPFV
ncbi:aladin-like [Chironomus tepperi]|uniref:aladin-like n=1 Tax=Chironomus tepperi TaxID=113505 RepID=UPI00391F4753